jgi:hypothetical protein
MASSALMASPESEVEMEMEMEPPIRSASALRIGG